MSGPPAPSTFALCGYGPGPGWNPRVFHGFPPKAGFQPRGYYAGLHQASRDLGGLANTDRMAGSGAKASRGRSLLLPRPPLNKSSDKVPSVASTATKEKGALAEADCFVSQGPQQPRTVQDRQDIAAAAGDTMYVSENGSRGIREPNDEGKNNTFSTEFKGEIGERQHCRSGITTEDAGVEGQRKPHANAAPQAAADCSSRESILEGEEMTVEFGKWNEDMVRFLFESYEAIHAELYSETGGKSKYHNKWGPILCLMNDKFGREFTKHQCQSKYYKVRRECAKYTMLSKKKESSDPSSVGRELLKPRFYEIWQDFGSKTGNQNPKISPMILELCKSDIEEGTQEEEGCLEETEEGFIGKRERGQEVCLPSRRRQLTGETSQGDLVSPQEAENNVEERSVINDGKAVTNVEVLTQQQVSRGNNVPENKVGNLLAGPERDKKHGRQRGRSWREEGMGLENGQWANLNVVDSQEKGLPPQHGVRIQSLDLNCMSSSGAAGDGGSPFSIQTKQMEDPSGETILASKEQPCRQGLPLAKRLKKVHAFQLLRDTQVLLCAQLKACEEREESVRQQGEVMRGILQQHVEHMEKWGTTMERTRLQQIHLLECVNIKLESLLQGMASSPSSSE